MKIEFLRVADEFENGRLGKAIATLFTGYTIFGIPAHRDCDCLLTISPVPNDIQRRYIDSVLSLDGVRSLCRWIRDDGTAMYYQLNKVSSGQSKCWLKAIAGLDGDFGETSDTIYENGLPCLDAEIYPSSTWAIPCIEFDDDYSEECWKWGEIMDQKEYGWPESAIAILNSIDVKAI